MHAASARACLLAHQLSRFASSNGAEGGSVEQPVWDEEDDMKPSNQPKRRERRRSRAPRFSGVQVAAALDLLANQTAHDLSRADFSAFEARKYSWQQLAQGVIESLARSLLELEDVAETSERAQLLWHRLEARRDAGVRTTRETQDAIQLMRRTAGCVASLSALRNGAPVHDVKASFDARLAFSRSGSASLHSSPTHPLARRLFTASCALVWRQSSAASTLAAKTRLSLARLSHISLLGPTRLVPNSRGATASEVCNYTFALCPRHVAHHFRTLRVAWHAWPSAKGPARSLNTPILPSRPF